jgi:YD repeat-containing protein
LVTETTSQYDQFGNIIQTTQNDSKGNAVTTKFKYPYQFAGTAVYDTMISRGITGPVIESENYLATTLTGKEKINYGFFNGLTLIKPMSISRQVSGNAPFLTTQFNRYDEFGNILEMQGIDGLKNSFIWSYFKSRLVAKVTGSGYSAIEAIINPQLLTYSPLGDQQLLAEVDKLRTQLPNTFVSTYLYEPKAGFELKQVKDPNGINTYYEYDAMGRLSRTRDNNNKIIIQLEYALKDVVSFPYRNVERLALFNRTDCPYGYAGSAFYVVPPNKYGSFISQSDANQKADNEINTNGQNYTNSNATCYPYWSYTSCCGFTSFTSTFTLTGSNSVTVSLVVQKSPPGGGSGIQIGTLSGPLFLPSVSRSIYYNSAGYSGMIQITPTGQVKLYGSYGSMPIQISGTYSL